MQRDAPPQSRGRAGLQFALLVETVLNNGGVNVLFIDFNRGEQASRNAFQPVIQRGVCFWLLTVAQFHGDFRRRIGQLGNR